MIKILSDMFDITTRVKQIDIDYEIFYDSRSHSYYLYAQNCYCLNLGPILDARVIKKIYDTRVENSQKIYSDIDAHNAKLDMDNTNQLSYENKYKFKELYAYADTHMAQANYNNTYVNTWV